MLAHRRRLWAIYDRELAELIQSEADRIRDESGCVLRYERSFMRPLLPEP